MARALSLLSPAVQSVDDDYSATIEDGLLLVDASAGDVTITLPVAADFRSEPPLRVKRVDASGFAVLIVPQSGETIDGAASAGLTSQYQSLSFKPSDGEWWIV